MSQITLRQAVRSDAAALVPLIHNVLRVSNTPDYGVENVERVVGHFTAEGIAAMIARCYTVIAAQDGHPVGTASFGPSQTFDTQAVRTFFVDPDKQRLGIGTLLLDALIVRARHLDLTDMPVRSSIAGEAFYAAHGFAHVQDHWDGDERTIEMIKHL